MRQKIFALLNPNSGPDNTLQNTILALHKHWEDEENELFIQLSRSAEDAQTKALRALELGADLIVCSGGDGTLNSLLPVLSKQELPVAFIPTGSVNAFARHFDIPLKITEAVKALKNGENRAIDLGTANDKLFVISCSFCWEASLIDAFEGLPTRGVATYVAAAGLTAFKYRAQTHVITGSDNVALSFKEPMLLSVTNLSTYTNVDLISDSAEADDGLLELAVVEKANMLKLTASLNKLKASGVEDLDMVETFRDSEFSISRSAPANIQIDGEVISEQTDVKIGVLPQALHIRVPSTND